MSKRKPLPATSPLAHVITPKKARRSTRGLAKTKVPVNKQAVRILRRVVSGEQLRGTRCFPYEFSYVISGIYGKGAATVAASLVANLVEAKLIDSHASSPMQDVLVYSVTDAGRKLAKDGPPAPDDSQLDWTAAPS